MKIILLISLVLSALLSKGQDNKPVYLSESDRPGISECASLVPKGKTQIESGTIYQLNQQEGMVIHDFIYNSDLIRYGLSSSVELRMNIEYRSLNRILKNNYSQTTVRGFNPVVVGAKVYLLKSKDSNPDITLHMHFNLPYFGKKDFRPLFLAPSFRIAGKYQLPYNLSITSNIGSQWNGITPNPTFLYTCSVEYALTDQFDCFVESYGFISEDNLDQHGIDSGFIILLTDSFQLDLSAGVLLNTNALNGFTSFGITWTVLNHKHIN